MGKTYKRINKSDDRSNKGFEKKRPKYDPLKKGKSYTDFVDDDDDED